LSALRHAPHKPHELHSILIGDLRRVSSIFFNDTATTEIYTLSLHDALPIFATDPWWPRQALSVCRPHQRPREDRKSTRLNSSHRCISYAVFCLKKNKRRGKVDDTYLTLVGEAVPVVVVDE